MVVESRGGNKHRRFVVAGAIVLAGLIAAVVIYATAPPPEDVLPWEMTDASKKYDRAVREFGGTANALAVDFNGWFQSLWVGQRLAYTVAVLSVAAAAIYLLVDRIRRNWPE